MAFSVAWAAYQNNICNGLSLLQQRGQFVDMTIAADGHHVKAHQMVLSLVSPYIGDLISSAACPHPVIFLNQVSYQTLQSILQYAYTGEVLVARDKISEFLDACKALHIRGVEDLSTTGQDLESSIRDQSFEPTISTEEQSMKLRNTSQQVIQSNLTQKSYLEKYESTAESDNDDINFLEEDHTPYHCGGASPTPSKDKLSRQVNKPISENLQYTVSLKGSLQVVCNRYLYFLMSSRKSGERMWRCMTYKRKGTCRAFLVTKENKIIKRVGAHNHPFHDAQIMKRLNKGNMFSALNEVANHVDSMKSKTSSSEASSNLTSVIINNDKSGSNLS